MPYAFGQFQKKYIAICQGHFDEPAGTIQAPISRKPNSIIERCVDPNGQTAMTKYQVIYETNQFSKVEIQLKTGRTHQIRVHMAYIGHPIVGDDLYGGPDNSFMKRQALHACQIEFIHPITHKKIKLTSPLPTDMQWIDTYKKEAEY